jgi:phosphoribosylglycinamide formyltransferase-1
VVTQTPPSQPARRIAILGSGRGSNAHALLTAWKAGQLGSATITGVWSDRPESGILQHAKEFGVPGTFVDPAPFKTKLEGDGERRFVDSLAETSPDLVVLAGFMRVLKPLFLNAFENRIINLHPSLLPAFPGLDAIGQAWRRGVAITGCTVHRVTAEIDAGPILGQSAVPVYPSDTLETLTSRVHAAEHALLPAVVARLCGAALTP